MAKRARSFGLMWVLCLSAFWGVHAGQPAHAAPVSREAAHVRGIGADLEAIVRRIEPVSRETAVRRTVAQLTFCLPQNALGLAYLGLLSLTGQVAATAEMNEVTIVATRTPFGVSLGRFLFIDQRSLSERAVRHEYGHTLQGYRHGPFYLLFEGAVSFAQACLSLLVPSFGAEYASRWPEDEANRLGGVQQGRTQ